MANGENAKQNGHIREYWSRRPFSGLGWGKVFKVFCHRKERRDAKKQAQDELSASQVDASTLRAIEELAERTVGSCRILDDDERALIDLAPDHFDQFCMRCACCDWWVEPGELEEGPDGEDICDGCNGYGD